MTGWAFRDSAWNLRCRFGSVAVAASSYVDANRVECVSPARAPDESALDVFRAASLVAVAVNGRDFSGLEASGSGTVFSYARRLEVFGLDPVRGPATGGTEVTVLGANFAEVGGGGAVEDAGRLFLFECRFDRTTVASNVGSIAATRAAAACVSPPRAAAGFVSVEIRVGASGNFTVFGAAFEFQAPVSAETLFPSVGSAGGGTLVTVTGSNFVASTREGSEATDGGGGAIAGTFRSSLRCRFGGGLDSAAAVVSSAVLRCETPGFATSALHRALAVDVSLNGGADFSGARTSFEAIAEPSVLALRPRAGAVGGGTVVMVFGGGFTPDAPVWCKFGTTGPIPAEFTGEGAVRCKSPAKAASSRIPVEVSRGNVLDLTRDAVVFSV